MSGSCRGSSSTASGRGRDRRRPASSATPFTIDAIGAPDKLTGSLTRPGGIIAQLAATQPDVIVEVTPLDRIGVPATDRELVPSHGRPRL